MARAGCIFLSSFNFIGTFSRRQDRAEGAPRNPPVTSVQRRCKDTFFSQTDKNVYLYLSFKIQQSITNTCYYEH